jgi:hypothetical protein
MGKFSDMGYVADQTMEMVLWNVCVCVCVCVFSSKLLFLFGVHHMVKKSVLTPC